MHTPLTPVIDLAYHTFLNSWLVYMESYGGASFQKVSISKMRYHSSSSYGAAVRGGRSRQVWSVVRTPAGGAVRGVEWIRGRVHGLTF